MTTTVFFASKSLGALTDSQLQRMLDRFGLGRLLRSAPTEHGVMKQTLFVTSTAGEFVLKGNPLYPGQWEEEAYFIRHLHANAGVKVPYPYLIDEADDIFGWSYALMPRLPGRHIHDPELLRLLHREDGATIAAQLGHALREMHRWKAAHPGEFDPDSGHIRPFAGSYTAWLYGMIRYWLDDAAKYSVITERDKAWVQQLLDGAQATMDRLDSPSFVMGDFKPENVLVQQTDRGWEVSGVIDFTTSYFGDAAADLPKLTALYLERGEAEEAASFLSAYIQGSSLAGEHGLLQEQCLNDFLERFRIHMLHQRLLRWGCAHAMKQIAWDPALSFSAWAEPYTEAAARLLRASNEERRTHPRSEGE
ncbi:MAG: aminoglycoside phosphotransferase family protein [Paenibacillus dendritiformis]|uniref:phosphotransferase family protein n=1 Tax=uncultured Paenibacillus sp. TaxID=227322 RepID=UPI0025EEEF7A|nr:aminoglycoside phosphotransferase family protein [uncultured Paenibacillus sp.]MDU5145560.1 aminoglycoside phosphotransferase family protein [Paenibacillus dendritiformis]